MIGVDTGPIVALFDKNDNKHHICVDTFRDIREPLIKYSSVRSEFSAGLGRIEERKLRTGL